MFLGMNLYMASYWFCGPGYMVFRDISCTVLRNHLTQARGSYGMPEFESRSVICKANDLPTVQLFYPHDILYVDICSFHSHFVEILNINNIKNC